MSWRILAILCFVLFPGHVVHGGEVLKTDDTLLKGNPLSFDGRTLQFTTNEFAAQSVPVLIPIQDIVRVRFQDSFQPNRAPRAALGFLPNQANNPGAKQDAPAIDLSAPWQLTLAGGDVVSGNLRSWSGDLFKIQFRQNDVVVEVPTHAIREIWRAPPELVRKALDLKIASNTEDVAYVLKDNDVVAVKGTAVGVEYLTIGFIFEGQQRKLNIERVLGVVLASQKRSPATRPVTQHHDPVATFVMNNGDRLSGRWTQLKGNSLSLETTWNQPIQLQLSYVAAVEIRNGQLLYLSDLKPAKIEETPYFDRTIRWRADSSLAGGPLKLNDGQQYAHGIAMHSRCVLEYDLGGQFEQFQARLGFEPTPPNSPTGRVAVRILTDGKALLDNPDLRGDQSPKDLVLDVHGAQRLILEVDFGQDQDVNDRVVWANARLLRANSEQ